MKTDAGFQQAMLKEGITSGILSDLAQWVVGGAVEYGITIGTAGAGVPAGIAAETFVDALFATSSINDALGAVSEMSGKIKEIESLIKKAMGLKKVLRSDFDQFYADVNSLVAKLIHYVGKKAGDKVEEIVEKIKDHIQKLVDKFSDAIVKGIKVLIPDETIGTAVGAAVRATISAASSKIYSAATSVIEKSKKFEDFLLKPGVAAEFFESVASGLTELLEKLKKKIEKAGLFSSLALGGAVANPVLGLAIKKLGPSGIDKINAAIKENMPKLTGLIDEIVEFVIPGFFACAAILQSLITGDYKKAAKLEKKSKEKSAGDEESSDQRAGERSNSEDKNESYIKGFILECLMERQRNNSQAKRRARAPRIIYAKNKLELYT